MNHLLGMMYSKKVDSIDSYYKPILDLF